MLLRESVLRCRVVGSRSSVGCTRILITVCNLWLLQPSYKAVKLGYNPQ